MTDATVSSHPTREWLVTAWAFSESLSWPLLPDMAVGSLAAGSSRGEAARLAACATVGSALGALVHHRLAQRGVGVPLPLTTPRMATAVDGWLNERGTAGFARQPLSGVPHKLFVARAPAHGLGAGQVVAATVVFRGPRLMATALGAVTARSVLQRGLGRFTSKAPVLARRSVAAACLGGFSLALVGMLRRWR